MWRRNALASSLVPWMTVTGNPVSAVSRARVQVAAVRSDAYCSNRMKFETGSMATRQISG
jgi:hypothetical protein